MPDAEVQSPDPADLSIDLKDPSVAAMLAWLVPGLGHWYQGRHPKAILFFVCILGTFLYGLYLGEGRVVYASWRPNDHRKPYFCQIGVGLAALPALVQAQRFRNPQLRADVAQRAEAGKAGFWDWFMAPPQVGEDGFGQNDRSDELDDLQKRLNRFFELGTVFTMIAGLLNVLAIYDACCGPATSEVIEGERRKQSGDTDPQPAGSPARS
jgi:hypothetical protein